MSCIPNSPNIKEYDFPTHIKGDTYDGTSFTITVNGSPLDLTGASIKISLKLGKDLINSALDLSTENNRIQIWNPPTDGKFQVVPQIISVPPGNYFYDIQITLADLTVKTYIEGRWRILSSVTV